jgi:hypothetical protein
VRYTQCSAARAIYRYAGIWSAVLGVAGPVAYQPAYRGEYRKESLLQQSFTQPRKRASLRGCLELCCSGSPTDELADARVAGLTSRKAFRSSSAGNNRTEQSLNTRRPSMEEQARGRTSSLCHAT